MPCRRSGSPGWGVSFTGHEGCPDGGVWGGVCALFPVDTGVASWLADRLGHPGGVVLPLHEEHGGFPPDGGFGRLLFRGLSDTGECLHISRYGTAGELSLAEVYPLHGAADMVYYLSELAAGGA